MTSIIKLEINFIGKFPFLFPNTKMQYTVGENKKQKKQTNKKTVKKN